MAKLQVTPACALTTNDEKAPTSNSGKKKGPLDVVVVYAFDSTRATPDYKKVDEIFWLLQKKLAKFRGTHLSYVYVELEFNRYTSAKKLVELNKYVTKSTTDCTKNMASGLPEAHRLISLFTENPNGVILLFSDGSPNNKGDFFDKAEEYVSTVPVHTFTLGSAAYNQGLSTIAANSPGGSFNSMPIPDKPDESSPLSQRLDAILLNITTSDDEKLPRLQVSPAAAFTEYNELNFQGLYLHHMFWNRPKANQAEIIENKAPIGIGATVVNNWSVYDGPGENAKLVARAQGLHTYAGNWHNSFSLVFVDERFSGSTLEVMGIVVETGEWAVVGGTGQFAMANGVISKRTHKSTSDGNIIELTIRAFCPQLKGTRYPVTKIGPFGGSEGSPMDITEAPRRLQSITVNTGWVLDSITFSYVDYTGQKRNAGRWGGPGGYGPHTIQLGESEFFTEVSGTVGKYEGQTVISSIKFVTNLNKTYGPWGEARENLSPFTIPVQPGNAIVGFFTRAGKFINAIGVHVRPL